MRRRLFIRRFALYFLMIILPLALTLYVYSTITKQQQIEKAQQTTLQSLKSVEDSLSLSLQNATYQRNLFTGAPRLMTALKKILTKNTLSYSDVVIIDCIKILINKSTNINLNIHSVYLSIDNSNRFLCSDSGIQLLGSIPDAEWHDLYISHDKSEKTWTCQRTYYEYDRPIKLISVYLRLYNAKGVIVVNLYQDRLQSMMNQVYFNHNEAVFLLNTDYEPLLANNIGTEYLDNFNKNINGKVDLSALDTMIPSKIRIGNANYYATLTPTSEYGFHLLSLIKENDYYTLSSFFNTTFVLQAISAIIIALIIALFVTFKNIKQFYNLFHVLNDAENGIYHTQEYPRYIYDEYDLIINNVVKTFISNESLKSELAEKQYLKTKIELTALQLQINPHFLFNSLQLLDNQAYGLTSGYTELNITIQKLSGILKHALGSPQEAVTLREDLKQVHSYTDINYKRYPNMFILYYDFEEDVLDYYVFRLILQPLIENSIYHGIRPLNCSRSGLIKVKIYSREDYLHFYIIDNGVGIEKDKLQQMRLLLNNSEISTNHIGLSNTNNRLVMYFGEGSRINIMSKYNMGTLIHFKIPQITQKEEFHLF